FIASLGAAAHLEAFKLAAELRKSSIMAACDENDRGLKAQMKYADKIGAKYSMVLGDDELANQSAELKNMKTGEKKKVSLAGDFVEQFVCIETEQGDLAF
ncbi:His/Gly/Thr/Pro-type tRNA ligase C-terminal domain-containing protein, partial [Blautia wexlerae]|nr:His/Gly/Thr/Pro-type tRNA ligase C-terminal domain-containing protein [Blautia wexlerae]